jgi:ribonucleoside-diphosphate reductase alpha chain
VSVKEDEWLEVGSWVYNNFDSLSGVSFLPYSEHTYKQAPYQECTEKEYKELLKKIPEDINWLSLEEYELEDTTTGSQELSCAGDVCEVVDIGQ